MSSTALFLDTNIYLHYQMFDQIAWPALAEVDEVTIVVPPITIRELNKRKDTAHDTRVARDRAGKVLRRFDTLLADTLPAAICTDVGITAIPYDPTIDFASYRLREELQDDYLVASIIGYRLEHSSTPNPTILLVTQDIGLRLKARLHDIQVLSLPDRFKLPEVDDPRDKELKKLRTDLAKAQAIFPRLKLAFRDEKNRATFRLSTPFAEPPKEVVQEMLELRKKANPYRTAASLDLLGGARLREMMVSHIVGSLSAEDIQEYNQEVAAFHHQCDQYSERMMKHNNMKQRTLQIQLLLINDGTQPANDLDINLHIPDGMQVYEDKNYPQQPATPIPPTGPRSALQKSLDQNRELSNVLLAPYSQKDQSAPRRPRLTITKTNSYDVDMYVDQLKHQMTWRLNTIYVVPGSFEAARSFTIDYRINAANMPQVAKGKLHVIVTKPF
jgi:PIN domain